MQARLATVIALATSGRAPTQEGALAWGFQALTPRMAYTWASRGPNQLTYSIGTSVMVGRVLAASSTPSGSSRLHTIGGLVDLSIGGVGPSSRGGWGDTVGSVFAGPYYEYLDFYDFAKRPYPD